MVEVLSNKFDNVSCNTMPPLVSSPKSDASIWPVRGVKRRREEQRPTTSIATDRGTKDITLSDLSVPSILPSTVPEKFWLYLSGLNPLATNSDVKKIVSRCLEVPDTIEVVRLVPKDKDISQLSFVSYKVGLEPCLKNKALDPSSWPAGLLFREFINQPKNSIRRAGTMGEQLK